MKRQPPRRRRPVAALLLLLCVALAGVIYLEATQSPAAPDLATVAARDAAAQPRDPVFTMPPLANFAQTTARPLFTPTRRPAAEATAAGPASAFALIGIVISQHDQHALLQHGTPPHVERVTEGQSVDGWTVAAIRPDRVVLAQGGSQAELKPSAKAVSVSGFPMPYSAPRGALPPQAAPAISPAFRQPPEAAGMANGGD